jgi:hypothetical protein
MGKEKLVVVSTDREEPSRYYKHKAGAASHKPTFARMDGVQGRSELLQQHLRRRAVRAQEGIWCRLYSKSKSIAEY